MDQTAKEIFLAAQNRLSLEKAGGSLERLLAEYPDPEDPDSEDKLGLTLSSGSEEKQGLYYILYQPGDEGNNDTEDIRQRLLPFGSIDETVHLSGLFDKTASLIPLSFNCCNICGIPSYGATLYIQFASNILAYASTASSR